MNRSSILFILVSLCLVQCSEIPVLKDTSRGFDFKIFATQYMWECVGAVLLVVYGVYFFMGRKKNFTIINNWYNEYRGLLEKNFTSVGISGNHGVFMRESYDQYRLFCSGRKNCQGMLFDFKLKKRQDLFSLLLDFITPVDDIMTIDIPFESDKNKQFIFALCRKRDYKSVHSENLDLKDMGRQIASQYTPDLSKVSGSWVVISDNNEVPASILTRPLINALMVSNCLLRLIHISDHMPAPTDNRVHLSDSSIRIRVKIPALDRMETMKNIMEIVMTIMDTVAGVHLSPKALAATTKARSTYSESQERKEHELRLERQRMLKEQKVKEEKEKMEKMSPEARAKYEAQMEKEEKKKMMKRRMKVVKV